MDNTRMNVGGFRRWAAVVTMGCSLLCGGMRSSAGLTDAELQEGPSATDLRRMYDDVVSQLKNAQDRKNELANENDKMSRRLAEAEKRTKLLEARNAELEREAADYASKTYEYRATHAAFQAFLRDRPEVRGRWEKFLAQEAGSEARASWWPRNWPLREG